jgi:hypothetical protein
MAVFREFKARPGSPYSNEQAVRYGRFLEARAGLGRRPVEADEIVRLAEDEDAEIHDAFEWDDTVAGHQYRLEQARLLARSILVVAKRDDGEQSLTRAFHYVTKTDRSKETSGYIAQRLVWRNPELSAQVVTKAFRELRSWRERYSQYSEMAQAVSAVGEVLDRAA